MDITIRTASIDDAPELLAIYAPYVKNTAITFEYDVPSIEDFRSRIEHTLKKHPYIVAVKDGQILGYAYTGTFVGRAAYDWSAETSIYLNTAVRKQGIGKLLYRALEDISRLQNIKNLNACIGYPEIEDEYLTKNSVGFHEHLGFSFVGIFHNCGYKFGKWYHMVWMEKILSPHEPSPSAVIPFCELTAQMLENVGVNKA